MPTVAPARLLSLDFMRGLIMVLLMLEGSQLYDRLLEASEGNILHHFLVQFTHHPWNGLRFWDLIQPGFMFIAGTALAYSLHHQNQAGVAWTTSLKKVFVRAALLFFWGLLLYAVRPSGLSFELWNVLTQLSVTTILAFLVFRWSFFNQFLFSMALLALTELLFRYTSISGFDQPFTDQHNFGNYVDLLLMNKTSSGGWVAINCIPTACHTIWGAMAGKLLFSQRQGIEKVKWLAITGMGGLVIGYTMDSTITPIIKRIATSSFVLASGGWCLLLLAFLYWWIDIKDRKKYILYFVIVGMNSLFIYLFIGTIGGRWLNGFVDALTFGILQYLNLTPVTIGVISSLMVFFLEWRLCWFLYRKGIFIKI